MLSKVLRPPLAKVLMSPHRLVCPAPLQQPSSLRQSSGRQTIPLHPQGADMCTMSYFVISDGSDRNLSVSITMIEVAMKTGGKQKGVIHIYPAEGEDITKASLFTVCKRGCLSQTHINVHTHAQS